MIALRDKTDQELAADLRMIVDALSKVRMELVERGVSARIITYTDGHAEVAIARVTKEVL
jgi:hypothetical protein